LLDDIVVLIWQVIFSFNIKFGIMATNKHAHIRYNTLDKCFANRFKKYFIDDLIKQCASKLSEYYCAEASVSRRQIFDDIAFMESEAGYSAPIGKYKDGKKVYYRYSDFDFSIHKKVISPHDEAQLKTALQTLNHINKLPGFEWLHEVNTKLVAGLNLQHITSEVMHFESNEFLKGIEYLSSLYQYIIHQQTLTVKYKSFKAQKADSVVLSPYYLKQYNNRWFLFGWNHQINLLQNLAIDRIDSINTHKTVYHNPSINFAEYFDDIIGVSNNLDAPVENVEIKLSDAIIPYIKSKPLHGSQIIRNNILSLKVKLNYEIESLILSYAEHMRVLKPATLKNKLWERLKKQTNNYSAD
jgi:predicted DNA-binding transcriptional regulator YafY